MSTVFANPLADLAGEFPVKSPEYFNFAYDVIDRWAEYDRNKLAMIWTNQHGDVKSYTFSDMAKLSNQAANLLLKNGISNGDRVFIQLPRLPEWWIFSLALQKIGAVQCPAPTLLMPADIKYRVNAGKFKMVITDTDNAAKFDEVFEECPTLSSRLLVNGSRPDWIDYQQEIRKSPKLSVHEVNTYLKVRTRSSDTMMFIFTSGTSKHPKMVKHRYDYALGHRITAELWHGLTATDRILTISDTGWGKNLWGNYFGQWIAGACVVVYDIRGKFNADELLPVIENFGVSCFCAPPTVYRMMILNDLSKFDFHELRSCTAAGEPLHTETVRIWHKGTGLYIREAYGQTETVCMIGNFKDIEPRPGSMGKAAPGWDIELHDDNGNVVPSGEEGRIALRLTEGRPVGLMESYYHNKEENERFFVNGFYYTGDKAYQDADGYYWYCGRSDDIIKSSG